MIDWWWNTIWIHVANAFDTFTELLLSGLAGTERQERPNSTPTSCRPRYKVTVTWQNPIGTFNSRTLTIYTVERVPVATYRGAIQAMIRLWA